MLVSDFFDNDDINKELLKWGQLSYTGAYVKKIYSVKHGPLVDLSMQDCVDMINNNESFELFISM